MALSKLEGQITVPTGGYTMSVTDSGGSASVTVAAAGTYYLSSTTSLLSAIGTALTANATLAGTYTLTLDSATSTSTGKVTLAGSGGGNFSVTWDSTALRDILGFTASLSGAASYTSPSASPYVWLPNVRRANQMAPDGNVGVPQTDATFTMAPTGTSKVLKYATRYMDNLEFKFLSGTKTWTQFESVTNESLQTFWSTVIANGYPIRYHTDRSADSTFVTYRSTVPHQFNVQPAFPGFVGSGSDGTALSWHWGPSQVIKYV